MNTKAFTLIEVLMVVIIIGILASLAIPGYISFKEKAYIAEAQNILDTMKTAQTTYLSQHGTFSENDQELLVKLPGTDTTRWNYAIGPVNPGPGPKEKKIIMAGFCTGKQGTQNYIGKYVAIRLTTNGDSGVTVEWKSDIGSDSAMVEGVDGDAGWKPNL